MYKNANKGNIEIYRPAISDITRNGMDWANVNKSRVGLPESARAGLAYSIVESWHWQPLLPFWWLKLQPDIFPLSQHVIRFHELPADTTQCFLQ